MKRSAHIALVALPLFWGCQDRHLPAGPETTHPGLAMMNAGNGDGGSPHFFFLPPLVKPPSYSGTFDPALEPVVQICRGVASPCPEGNVVASFTSTTGPGSQTVRLDAAEERYAVNWHTRLFLLDLTQVYRVRVLVGTTELGHADVSLVSNGKEAKSGDGSTVALVDGQTLPIRFRIEIGAVVHTEPASIQADALALYREQLTSGVNRAMAISRMIEWLRQQPSVAWVSEGYRTEIAYVDGTVGGITIPDIDPNTGATTKGGAGSSHSYGTAAVSRPASFRKANRIGHSESSANAHEVDSDRILIYAPFDGSQPAFAAETQAYLTALEGQEHEITVLRDHAASVAALRQLGSYGMIVLNTHGSQGRVVLTGERPSMQYVLEIVSGLLTVESIDGLSGAFLGVTAEYIAREVGQLANSFVINSSCESSKSDALADAFYSKGAGAYFGWTETVYTDTSIPVMSALVGKIAAEYRTSRRAYLAFNGDFVDPRTSAMLHIAGSGNPLLHYRIPCRGASDAPSPHLFFLGIALEDSCARMIPAITDDESAIDLRTATYNLAVSIDRDFPSAARSWIEEGRAVFDRALGEIGDAVDVRAIQLVFDRGVQLIP